MACTWHGIERGRGGDVHHRVRHELARAVIRDVAAPVGLHQLGTHGDRIDQHVGTIGVRPQREHVGVLEHEEVVVTAPVVHGTLDSQRFDVRDPSEPPHPEHVTIRAQSSAAQSWEPRSSTIRATNAAAYAPSTARWSQDKHSNPRE